MTPSPTAAPTRLLTQAAEERQTGALVVGGHPGGAVYVLEGRVIYAESPAAPGVGELLTSSGRLAGRTWQNALDLGTSTARVGRLLMEQGHLTRGELELCVLGATYDAAFFALAAAGGPVEFLDGATHWLGPVVHIDPAAVNREVRRRVRLLDEIFPDARVDTAAVSPVPRPPRERVTVTAFQWELLVNADGQRTPADLALLLGKAGYATIQELRRLAALGLIEVPEVRTDAPEFVRLPRGHGTAVAVERPAVPVISGSAAVAVVPAPAPAGGERAGGGGEQRAQHGLPPTAAGPAQTRREAAQGGGRRTRAGPHRHRRSPAQTHTHRTTGVAVTRAPPPDEERPRMTVDPAVLEELDRLSSRLPELSGSVLASTDGLVIAHDAHGIEPDSIAALAAAHLALARRFAHTVNHGELRESVVECDRGYITSYTAGPNALLTVVTSGDANLAMVHLEARRCVRRLVRILALEQKRQPRPEIPTQPSPAAPLVRRTPMASLAGNAHRQAAG